MSMLSGAYSNERRLFERSASYRIQPIEKRFSAQELIAVIASGSGKFHAERTAELHPENLISRMFLSASFAL